ncbi:uncharacterized protein LOC111023953 isoform X1 [Momordica charantia]|uniref:Uncharacterized protein LOC111023953 isoform X1 n=1 Tax=Momordica charantia TaxID=3673 RepID=A0A6J1DSD4_MOMCH|nr:uncharacterized protein LOC111023953 isoform X1 [Momordica charantia]XP_022157175.1 uncharacterized protein LOC111023953 isoform X1 [Momordica charantia]
MAVGGLKRAYEEVKDVSEKLQSKLQHCGSQFQNFATGYLLLGRLFFSTVSQNSSLNCHHWCLILALTLLCALVYFLLFLDALTLLYQTQIQIHMILNKFDEIGHQLILEAKDDDDVNVEAGEQYCSDDYGFELGFYRKMLMFDHLRIVGMKVYIYITASALLAVMAIELCVSKYWLCRDRGVGD